MLRFSRQRAVFAAAAASAAAAKSVHTLSLPSARLFQHSPSVFPLPGVFSRAWFSSSPADTAVSDDTPAKPKRGRKKGSVGASALAAAAAAAAIAAGTAPPPPPTSNGTADAGEVAMDVTAEQVVEKPKKRGRKSKAEKAAEEAAAAAVAAAIAASTGAVEDLATVAEAAAPVETAPDEAAPAPAPEKKKRASPKKTKAAAAEAAAAASSQDGATTEATKPTSEPAPAEPVRKGKAKKLAAASRASAAELALAHTFTPAPVTAIDQTAAATATDAASKDDPAAASAPAMQPQLTVPPPGVTVVNDAASAARALAILTAPGMEERFHACDTETIGIDPKTQSPVGNGHAICLSVYCGPDVDFGSGPRLWVDNLDGAAGVLNLFKGYLEDPKYKKVWHNYSFDRHVLYNDGINVLGFGGDTLQMARLWNSARTVDGGYSLEALSRELLGPEYRKKSMTERFAAPHVLKDGTVGKTMVMPGTLELQRRPDTRTEWIEYSCLDTEATWHLRERLQAELERWPWAKSKTMWDFYRRYWCPFGEMLTDMEREGIYVRRDGYLPTILAKAEADKRGYEEEFLSWARTVHPNGKYMNACSEQQKQHLFFAPATPDEDPHASGLPHTRAFDAPNTEGYIEPGKVRAKKTISFELAGLGLPVLSRTPKGKPQSNIAVLKELAGSPEGNNPRFGLAYDHFGGGEAGEAACKAIYSLIKLAGVETMISTFIEPLSQQADHNSRVHCSLGLNTETGRLSARRPNLQNQPNLEKDVYRVRNAFAAAPGKKLIVADYGQLELRILAHIARCKSMIDAFALGGDFHSRTAMGMYPYVAEAVDKGDVLLEWDTAADGPPPKPLLKDTFSSERRKAKVLNFSIAYGKTAAGLAKDWNVSLKEAKDTVNAWFADRPEVREWQERTIEEAHRSGVTRTLMGRYRPLHGINDPKRTVRSHAERAAINTPIQGGAADVVMAAMLKLHANERFRELDWKILLQIHDELICEGPAESSEEALGLVWECMGRPFKDPLLVDLVVDGSAADTWYEGK